MSTWIEKLEAMRLYAFSTTIEFNEHRQSFCTVAEYIEFLDLDADDFGGEEIMKQCIAANSLVRVACYPTTQVGFYNHFGIDIVVCVEAVYEAAANELAAKR